MCRHRRASSSAWDAAVGVGVIMRRAKQQKRGDHAGVGDRWMTGGLLLGLAVVVSLAVIGVVKGCTWVGGNRGPAWMDFSASTNADGAVRILEPGGR